MKREPAKSLRHTLGRASLMVEKKMMRDFAHKFGLVYFGTVHAGRDDYDLIRGVTLQTDHQDRHYTVGNYKGRDVMVVQRRVRIAHPQHGSKEYKWTLVQVDLHQRQLPHVLVTANHNDPLFFNNLQIKLANFQQLTASLIPHAQFANHFRVLSAANSLDELPTVLTPEIMAAMAQYFKHFDVEFFDDQLIVYAPTQHVTPMLLQELLREALWLAERLDAPLSAQV